MFKARNLVVFGLVVCAGQVAYGQQGEARSYWGIGTGRHALGPTVPAGGFVLTDIVVFNNPADWTLCEAPSQDATECPPGSWKFTGKQHEYHFESGIPFTPGQYFFFDDGDIGSTTRVTLSGYIPSTPPNGNVPAVGAWGLAVMVLMILAGGTMVLRRRRIAA